MSESVKTGTVEGTGAAIEVEVGFVPSVVKLMNIDGDAILNWNDQMEDGEGYKILTGIDATEDVVSIHSFISTGGVTPADGGFAIESGEQVTKEAGFSIGTDSDINVEAETIVWEAYR